MRDEFPQDVKDVLFKRAGGRCSNPNCRQSTSGPQEDPNKAVNIGVAAHITAADDGGPRYDACLTSEERRSAENGIWLCQNHAKLIDNDEERFAVDTIRKWKRLSEEAARLEIERPRGALETTSDDAAIIRFFAQCFDRPAFQDPFHQEGSMEAFDKAIEDTITALNTGCLRARDGGVLAQGKGKAYLADPESRDRMGVIVDLLRAIRSRYEAAVRVGTISTDPRPDGHEWYCVRDGELVRWMDSTREQVLELFDELAAQVGAPVARPPRLWRRW